MPKILISDAMDNIAEKILTSNNIDVDVKTDFTVQELLVKIEQYDGLIVRSATKVTKEIIEKAKNLKIIGRAGAGVDNIDLLSAKEKNIIVMNTPGGNTNATAEHTLALLLSLYRKIVNANISTHKGEWAKKKFKGNEIRGKTLGIIGFGNVGKRFAEICHALGLKILMVKYVKLMPIVILERIIFLNFYHRDGMLKVSVQKKPAVLNKNMEIPHVLAVPTIKGKLLLVELNQHVIYVRVQI